MGTGKMGIELYSFNKKISDPISITKDNLTLMAQGTGEPAIPFDTTEKDKFEFLRAGIKLEFKPAENQMIYSQRGESFTMTRK